MKKFLLIFFLFISAISSVECFHRNPSFLNLNSNVWKNDIPARYQWNNNNGYCGEVSLISAGLYYGQYVSQYDARATACQSDQAGCQLLLGKNDTNAAQALHLNYIEWDGVSEQSTDQFLSWVKEMVLEGYPVAIGIFTNEYLFYGNTNPTAGDKQYDHIVPVIGISSNHALTDQSYYGDDRLYFSDNGLWGDPSNPPYFFDDTFDHFQMSRKQANAVNGSIYSLSNSGTNYGIAITGIKDSQGVTLPVRITTNVNAENPQIDDGSDTRPTASPVTLTITVSNLRPGFSYILYRYNDLSLVPEQNFNALSSQAFQSWPIELEAGSVYSMSLTINSDEIAVFRAVRESAP